MTPVASLALFVIFRGWRLCSDVSHGPSLYGADTNWVTGALNSGLGFIRGLGLWV